MAKREFNKAYKVLESFGLVDSIYGSQYEDTLAQYLIPVREGMRPVNPYKHFMGMCENLLDNQSEDDEEHVELCKAEFRHLNTQYLDRMRYGGTLLFRSPSRKSY